MLVEFSVVLVSWRNGYEYLKRKCFVYESRTSKTIMAATEFLSMLMPKFVIDRITNFSDYGLSVADDVGNCTVLFCDIVDFDSICENNGKDVVIILDELFRNFDRLCSKYGVQKIETVGKTYMAAAGINSVEERLPEFIQEINFTARVIELAREMMKFVGGYKFVNSDKVIKIVLKIGIHYGQCMMGVIGYHKPQFSLIGDTINYTSRHCTTGLPGHIMVSKEAWIHGQRWDLDYEIVDTQMKGKGIAEVFHLYQKFRHLKNWILEAIEKLDVEFMRDSPDID